jgi:hypothetical protein
LFPIHSRYRFHFHFPLLGLRRKRSKKSRAGKRDREEDNSELFKEQILQKEEESSPEDDLPMQKSIFSPNPSSPILLLIRKKERR